MKFQLTGWKAIAFLAAFAALIVGKNAWHKSDPQGAVKTIEPWLKGQYSQYFLDRARAGEMSMEDAGMKIAEMSDKIDIKVTGIAASSKPVVCVKIRVDGEKPPVGKDERCFRLGHSALLGWTYDRESDIVGYYLEMLRPW